MKWKTVVAATDFSDASLIALETAFNLDIRPGGKIYVLHVVEIPRVTDPIGGGMANVDVPIKGFEERATQRLETLIPENLPAGLTVEAVAMMSGSTAYTIADFARSKNADLIVVGTHGRRGLARVFLGSTAEALLREAPCQVLVAKPKAPPAAAEEPAPPADSVETAQ